MANNFKRYSSRNIGTSLVAIGSYTVPTATQVVPISTIIANKLTTAVTCSVLIDDGTNQNYLLTNGPIPAGGSIIIPKFVLQAGDSLKVQSSDAASLDVTMSVLERI